MLTKFWFDLNYRYAMSQRYLLIQQGRMLDAVEWERKAWEWQQAWRQA